MEIVRKKSLRSWESRQKIGEANQVKREKVRNFLLPRRWTKFTQDYSNSEDFLPWQGYLSPEPWRIMREVGHATINDLTDRRKKPRRRRRNSNLSLSPTPLPARSPARSLDRSHARTRRRLSRANRSPRASREKRGRYNDIIVKIDNPLFWFALLWDYRISRLHLMNFLSSKFLGTPDPRNFFTHFSKRPVTILEC